MEKRTVLKYVANSGFSYDSSVNMYCEAAVEGGREGRGGVRAQILEL